jgi:hypothetical protein
MLCIRSSLREGRLHILTGKDIKKLYQDGYSFDIIPLELKLPQIDNYEPSDKY